MLSFAGLAGSTVRGADSGPFRTSIIVERPISEAWAAITLKRHVDAYYFAPISADITRSGSPISYGTAQQQMIVGKVVTLRAPSRLVHTFRFVGGDRHRASLASYRLMAKGQRTLIEIEHGGFANDSQDYANIAMGWPIILSRLKAHLEAR